MLANCSSRDREPVARLVDYEYPLDSLCKGKILRYKKKGSNKYSEFRLGCMKEEGQDYLIEVMLKSGKPQADYKYRITPTDRELVASSTYLYENTLSDVYTKEAVTITAFRPILDGSKYRGIFIEEDVATRGGYSGEVLFEEVFSREGAMRIDGQEVATVIFNTKGETSAWVTYLPIISTKSIYEGENVYAKGKGLVRFWLETENKREEWELVEIVDAQ